MRITLKDHFRENRLFLNRTLIALVAVLLLMATLAARLVYLQVIGHAHFTTLSQENRVRLVALPPPRGLIFDRNGVPLADNRPAYRLEVIPEQVADMEATLERLGKIIELRATDLKRFRKLLARKRRFDGIPLRFRLGEEEVARFAVHRHEFPGVDIQAYPTRHYPDGPRIVHAVGYVGRIDEEDLQHLDPAEYSGTSHIGKVGVEKFYETLLHGRVGFRRVEVNAQGRVLRVLEETPPIPGANLYLSLDVRLQALAERALGDYNGAVVALDPRTGEVLALVSKPGYDPNAFVNGIDPDDYAALQSSEDRPLFNRALRGRYPPGSTIKPFIGLAALDHGVVSPAHQDFCPGYYVLPGDKRRYRDWKKEGHGPVDLTRAIVESCDVYFYGVARNLGIDRIQRFLAPFGFGARTGIDISGEQAGLLPSREWKRRTRSQPWFPGETLITGIGQGFLLVTPIELASATATLAMRGRRVRPHIVQAVEDPLDGTRQAWSTEVLPPVPVTRPAHWEHVIAAMVKVVHSAMGTARRIGPDAPYRIAGKTGTAQVFGIKEDEEYEEEKVAKKLRDHALFIAFAPADEPRIAVAVVVENGGSGGAVAAPIARRVMDAYLLKYGKR